MNNSELQKLIDYCWEVIEENEQFDAEKCPDLDKCFDEMNILETICFNYLLMQNIE